eukprot:CAMPEP_0116968176 /NCGR_PEP_ID=MMETSP0467-20121206/51038_1 /TAXON_ID=283647 /ORGANISM="Mesodinium pulex, Strain SPMC105" /LENGTH=66 /DNA_ID=CAMNT_0004658321 /DNA_START=378 /DNA_END=578 /DNA_ORIENTATION=+
MVAECMEVQTESMFTEKDLKEGNKDKVLDKDMPVNASRLEKLEETNTTMNMNNTQFNNTMLKPNAL